MTLRPNKTTNTNKHVVPDNSRMLGQSEISAPTRSNWNGAASSIYQHQTKFHWSWLFHE